MGEAAALVSGQQQRRLKLLSHSARLGRSQVLWCGHKRDTAELPSVHLLLNSTSATGLTLAERKGSQWKEYVWNYLWSKHDWNKRMAVLYGKKRICICYSSGFLLCQHFKHSKGWDNSVNVTGKATKTIWGLKYSFYLPNSLNCKHTTKMLCTISQFSVYLTKVEMKQTNVKVILHVREEKTPAIPYLAKFLTPNSEYSSFTINAIEVQLLRPHELYSFHKYCSFWYVIG